MKLTSKQQKALVALLWGEENNGAVTQAAEAAKVSEQTISKWLEDPDFQAAYQEGMEEMDTYLFLLALKTLRKHIQDENAKVSLDAINLVLKRNVDLLSKSPQPQEGPDTEVIWKWGEGGSSETAD